MQPGSLRTSSAAANAAESTNIDQERDHGAACPCERGQQASMDNKSRMPSQSLQHSTRGCAAASVKMVESETTLSAAAVAATTGSCVSRSARWRMSSRRYALSWSTFSHIGLLLLMFYMTELSSTAYLLPVTECEPLNATAEDMMNSLTRRQRELVQNSTDIAALFSKGERCAIKACQKWMAGTKWGCYLNHQRFPYFGKAPTPRKLEGTKEGALLSAVESAGAMVKLSRECGKGHAKSCSCPGSMNSQESFEQSACAEEIAGKLGLYHLARSFSDYNEDDVCDGSKYKGPDPKLCRVNLHNNRVGREIIIKRAVRSCRCSGPSGSCTIQTCIKYLPDILVRDDIQDDFQVLFTQAKQIYVSTRMVLRWEGNRSYTGAERLLKNSKNHKQLLNYELAFYNPSPKLCSARRRNIGVPLGERYCRNEGTSVGSCHYLCCGKRPMQVRVSTNYPCNHKLRLVDGSARWVHTVCQKTVIRNKCRAR